MCSRSPAEFAVSGALACAMHVSRAAGIAPLQLKRVRTGCRAWVSLPVSVYGKLLTIALCVLALVVLVLDFIVEDGPSERGTVAKKSMYFLGVTLLVLLVLTASFTGTMRMKDMATYLNQIHQMTIELNSYRRAPSYDKELWLLLILSMIGGIFTIALDYGVFINMTIFNHGNVVIAAMYIFYFLLYFELLMIQTQFALIVITALSPLVQLNECLKDLLPKINSEANRKTTPQMKLKMNNYILPDFTNTSIKVPRNTHSAVRRLAILHGCVCDVVRLIDKSHGPILLILLVSYLLHLVVSLYFIVSFLLIDSGAFVINILIQIVWGIFHISSLIAVVEPCHRTQEEMANTRELVSLMTLTVPSPDDPLAVELEVFYRHLMLNQVAYSPLKMFTINRSLIITMLSAITTYLVVVIQIKEPQDN